MSWRLAPALVAMRDEANRLAPKRSKRSDGTIGDVSHSSRTSDHNPDKAGWVDALDLTHDPAGGFDAHARADQIAARGDKRISYIISNRRIWNPALDKPGVWRKYTGSNPHTLHAHFSVADAHRQSTAPWWPTSSTPAPKPIPTPVPKPQPTNPFGDEDDDMQIIVNKNRHRMISGVFHNNISKADSDAYAYIGVQRKTVPDNFWDLIARTTVEAQNVNVAAFWAKDLAGRK